jgi:hypothetical protein
MRETEAALTVTPLATKLKPRRMAASPRIA